MPGTFKLLVHLLRNNRSPISAPAIIRTLLLLAILKRTRVKKDSVKINLGNYIISAPDYEVLSFLIKEKFIGQEYYFKADNPAPVIIDCGANIGISLIYFKCLYPDAAVHCFEPNAKAFYFLEKNVLANKLKNIFLYKEAVSDINGIVNLYIPESGKIINASLENTGCPESVCSVRLSDAISNIKNIDLIKIDVEGSEDRIIRELADSIQLKGKKIKMFIIEYHFSSIKTKIDLENLIQILECNNYATDLNAPYSDCNPIIMARLKSI
jgi:FkbM family methyltransferase